MTADDLFRLLGKMDDKARKSTPITVQVGNGPTLEVGTSRKVPYHGHPALRLQALPVELTDENQPRLQVKYLRLGAHDRRTANWITVTNPEGRDLFPRSEAEGMAAQLIADGRTEHSRTWDPVEGAAVKDFEVPPPRNGQRVKRMRRPEPAEPGRHPTDEALRRKGARPPPRPPVIKSPEETGFSSRGISGALGGESPGDLGAVIRMMADPKLPVQETRETDWKALLRERHPETSGYFWLDVRWQNGEMDDTKAYEYKTRTGVIKAVETLLGGPVDERRNYHEAIWIRGGFGRNQRVVLCVQRGPKEGIEVDVHTEYNLGLRKR